MRRGEGGVGTAVAAEQDMAAPIPLSPGQLRWWVAAQLAPEVPATIAMYLDLRGPLDPVKLAAATVSAAVALQSPQVRLCVRDGQPGQYLDPEVFTAPREIDLTGRADPVDEALRRMEADRLAPLDLCADPITVASLYRVAAGRWLLYLRSHHLVLDGVGAAALLRRTADIYSRGTDIGRGPRSGRARAGGDRAPLSIRELVEQEQRYRRSSRAEIDRSYWANEVAGPVDPVGLAGVPAPASARPHRVSACLDERTAALLARAMTRHDATFPELSAAAFTAFLARMADTDAITVSLPVAARPTAALRRSAGSVSNVVPLRVRGLATATVGDLITQVRLRVIGALRHQRCGYEDIQRARGETHVLRGGFGPVLNLLGATTALTLGPVTGHAHLLSLGPVEDLLVNAYQLGPDTTIDFQANPARYDPATLAWYHRLFLTWLDTFLAADSSTRLRDLSPSTPPLSVRTRRLSAGGATAPCVSPPAGSNTDGAERGPANECPRGTPFSGDHGAFRLGGTGDGTHRVLGELFSAFDDSDAVAVVDDARSMTYRELAESAAQWARILLAHGAAPGEPVVMAIPRSLESVLAVRAIAAAGACLAPVDTTDPGERLHRIITSSGAVLGLTTMAVAHRLGVRAIVDGDHAGEQRTSTNQATPSQAAPALRRKGQPGARSVQGAKPPPQAPWEPQARLRGNGITWLVVDDPDTAARLGDFSVEPISEVDRDRRLSPDHPAYLIHTSGTTGAPKGVEVTHRGLGPLTDHLLDRYRTTPNSTVLHAHSPAFDAHLLELLAAFAAGARLVVEPPEVVAGVELARLIDAHTVTHLLTTPAVLATLAPEAVPSLETVVVGGETCPAELVALWAPRVRLHNGYGPTEATVMATQSAALVAGEPVTIGASLPGTRALLLDSRLRPAPAGARAELYLAGPGVAAGYVGDPAGTAARFVADPSGTGQRIYRTGDLVGPRADGGFEFLGRIDAQVCLRGRRVEPAEVEAALLADPAITHAAVDFANPGTPTARLIGYVVAAPGIPFDGSAALARLRTTLPAALVPAALVVLDQLPLTGNGKLDRDALPTPPATHYRAPETPLQQLIATRFATACATDQVGADDDFFALGGNSLLGVQVAAELAGSTGLPITVRWLYTAPTPSALAARITGYGADSDPGTDALATVLPLRRGGARPPLFCIHSAVPLAWCYAGLSHQITDRPVYGLQAPVLSGLPMLDPDDIRTTGRPALSAPASTDALTIAGLAETYAAEIGRVHPDGPIHLLGWSLGGQLAHAVAIRLHEQGRAVASLTMLDSVVIPDGAEPPPRPRMRDLLTHLLGDEPADADTLADLSAEQAASELATTGASLGSGLSAAQLTTLHAAYADGVRLSHGYRPGVFDGDLLYFCATEGMTGFLDARMWRPHVTGRLIEHPVATTHAQLTNADVVARIGPIIDQHLRTVDNAAAREVR
ncbi:hypothetical protein BOX37_24120 [Nocardia mangyaensis]|uniref:Carrier domain-containing protein n=1 Tax=Nocardia mangyaensis TaxID=2213200 RepID=A0A1J0VWQ1_9NOCA|nr:AMP-binding protein [Nocardia mangyaensis]APE36504.1 hypothetical protein BOX37_24120 [Nocardia mangyaensis]